MCLLVNRLSILCHQKLRYVIVVEFISLHFVCVKSLETKQRKKLTSWQKFTPRIAKEREGMRVKRDCLRKVEGGWCSDMKAKDWDSCLLAKAKQSIPTEERLINLLLTCFKRKKNKKLKTKHQIEFYFNFHSMDI